MWLKLTTRFGLGDLGAPLWAAALLGCWSHRALALSLCILLMCIEIRPSKYLSRYLSRIGYGMMPTSATLISGLREHSLKRFDPRLRPGHASVQSTN